MSNSLAKGAKLDQATFDDFVARLRHDCVGDGVTQHYTAHAIFIVQDRVEVFGIDRAYASKTVIIDQDQDTWHSPDDYYNDECFEDDYRERLDDLAKEISGLSFLEMLYQDKLNLLESEGLTVTGHGERWEYVCSHFTNDAAQAFIDRKKHDYRELRIVVEAQSYCWEFEAIKRALIYGQLVLSNSVEVQS